MATIVLPGLVVLGLLLLPFLDRRAERRPWRRPLVSGAFVLLLAVASSLTYLGLTDGASDDRVPVHQGLVAAVPPQQHTGHEAGGRVVTRDPDGNGSLARAAYGEVADRHAGQRQIVDLEPAAAIGEASDGHGAPPEPRRGQQGQARQARVRTPARPEPAHDPVGIAPSPHPHASAISSSRALASAAAMESSNREHKAIVDAIASRDAARAAATMANHIQQGKARFLAAAADSLED